MGSLRRDLGSFLDFSSGQDGVIGNEFILSPETKNWARYTKQLFSRHCTSDNKGSDAWERENKRGEPTVHPSLLSRESFQDMVQEGNLGGVRWSPWVEEMQLGGQGGQSSQGRVFLKRQLYRKRERVMKGSRKRERREREWAWAKSGDLQRTPRVFWPLMSTSVLARVSRETEPIGYIEIAKMRGDLL